ncbi:MAG: glycosyltransferase [Prevotella sp.]|nr:glycosyltransferase [Prevotella sp.]
MKVTVITVAYNSSKTLADAIESVLRQTYRDIEYWIIDGMSNDDSVEIIKKYESAFEGRLHWISEKDRGIYDAMNKGIRMATGDVIGILNSDDFFTSDDVIEKMVEQFTDDIDAIYGDVHFIKEDNEQRCVRYYSGRIFRPYMVKFGFVPPHPSFYARKKLFDQYGLYDDTYTISADFEMIARLCWKYKVKMKYVHLDFVCMRVGGASTRSVKNRTKGTNEVIKACKKLGIKTCIPMVYMKYPIKILESLIINR